MPAEAFYSLESGYHAANLEVAEAEFRLMARERWRKIGLHVHPSDDLFEFGVGTGLNLACARAARRAGSDVSGHLSNSLESLGVEYFESPCQLPEHSFDVVFSHHSLEHVSAPHDVLRELRRILRPNGRLVVFVPFEKERRYRRFDDREPNHHLFSWNVQTLGNLVEVCGFTVESCKCGPTGYERFAARIAVRAKLGEFGYRALLQAFRVVHRPEEVRLVARKGGSS
jgi:SAM-dependent methyltransferase